MLATIGDGTYTGSWLGMASDAFQAGNFEARFDNLAVYTGNCIAGTAQAATPACRTASFAGPSVRDGEGRGAR